MFSNPRFENFQAKLEIFQNMEEFEMIVEKKAWPELFEKVLNGGKKADVRVADFKINSGDTLVFKEYNPETKQYTGRKVEKKVLQVNKIDLLKLYKPEDLKKNGVLLIELE